MSEVLLPLGSAGFKYVFGIFLHHPHIIEGVAVAFAIWASCHDYISEADGYSTDSEPANARLGVEQTGHLAFSTDTLTSLASEATFRLLKG